MKRMIAFLLCLIPVYAFSDVVYFKSGRRVTTQKAWEEGNLVKCYVADGVVSYPKSIIEKIEIEEQVQLTEDPVLTNAYAKYCEDLLQAKKILEDRKIPSGYDVKELLSRTKAVIEQFHEYYNEDIYLPDDIKSSLAKGVNAKNEVLKAKNYEEMEFANLDASFHVGLSVKYTIEKNCEDNNIYLPIIEIGKPEDRSVISQNESFIFDGFNWQILNVYRLPKVGRPQNLQSPINGSFLVIEALVENLSGKARYWGRNVLIADGKQYSESSKIPVYAEHNLGYDSHSSTKLEPGATIKMFFGFDTIDTDNNILVMKPWSSGDAQPIRVKLKNIRKKDV